jgi:hypothetical protein
MNNTDSLAFAALFKEVYLMCFGQQLEGPLTETESKLLCNKILERTGLSIGWKSIKNYSFFISGDKNIKPENPSTATLDTLARYALGAPYTTEIQRKDNESHYPWWFLYREKFNQITAKRQEKSWRPIALIVSGVVTITVMFIFWLNLPKAIGMEFTDKFKDVSDSSLSNKGWFVKDKDEKYWRQKASQKGQLTLFTLKGDNWPDPSNKQDIKNLLLRTLPYDCFTAEVHLNNFIPNEEWQQAGILLLEDTTLSGKSIRLSVAYNDYFAGAPQPREIYVQAISSLGNGFGKPEEFAHKPIAYPDSGKTNPIQLEMLQHSALRIERRGKKFRFLFSDGITENGAFKEVASQEFDVQPKYIGIFAIKGFKDNTAIMPVRFTFFRIAANSCQ